MITIDQKIRKKLQNPEWTLNNLYRIIDKSGNDIPFKLNWAQKDMLENMHKRNLILKARQLGSTTFWCIYFLNKALFQPNQRLGIISYSLSSSHDIFKKIIKHAYKTLSPEILALPQCQVVTDSAREIGFANGSSIRVDTTMRSGTLSGLLITEFGKICSRYPRKAQEIMTGSLNTVSKDALCVIESTAEGAAGFFFDMCKEAMENKGELSPLDWRFFFFPWHMEPAYSLEMPNNVVIPKYVQEYFKKLEAEGINTTQEQQYWYFVKQKELGEDVKQEYPSNAKEAFEGSTEGFWYHKEISQAKNEGRVTNVPYQPQCLVYAAWDLGISDSTAIWLFQILPSGAVHIIDYYENQGEGLTHYYNYINTQKYRDNIAKHYFPHDAAAREKGSGLSLAQQAKDLGMPCEVLNRYNPSKNTFVMEIQRVRNLIARSYFDMERCAQGIKMLESYRKKWNEQMGCYSDEPVHDYASHGSDSFRYLSQAVEQMVRRPTTDLLKSEYEKVRKARSNRV